MMFLTKPLRAALALALAGIVLAPAPADAKVQDVSDYGFVVRHVAEVPVDVPEAWEALLAIGTWWDDKHTYSGDARNMTLDPRAGGCFCEVLPNPVSANAAPRGGVEHMRVIYVENARALRMTGALGPLQSDAVNGTLTFMLKPSASGTQILVEYVVGGYMRAKPAEMAPQVDQVLGEQVARLAMKLGGKASTMPMVPEPRSGLDGAGSEGPRSPDGSAGQAGQNGEMIGR